MVDRLKITILAMVVSTSLIACGKSEERARVEPEKTTPTVTETERPGTESPSDITPVTARLRVSDLKVGVAVGADGVVVENIDEMGAGDTVHASLRVADAGAGSRVRAVWLDSDGKRLGEEEKVVSAGASHLAFVAPMTTGWRPGDYKVEIYLGDELASSESFDIVERTGR